MTASAQPRTHANIWSPSSPLFNPSILLSNTPALFLILPSNFWRFRSTYTTLLSIALSTINTLTYTPTLTFLPSTLPTPSSLFLTPYFYVYAGSGVTTTVLRLSLNSWLATSSYVDISSPLSTLLSPEHYLRTVSPLFLLAPASPLLLIHNFFPTPVSLLASFLCCNTCCHTYHTSPTSQYSLAATTVHITSPTRLPTPPVMLLTVFPALSVLSCTLVKRDVTWQTGSQITPRFQTRQWHTGLELLSLYRSLPIIYIFALEAPGLPPSLWTEINLFSFLYAVWAQLTAFLHLTPSPHRFSHNSIYTPKYCINRTISTHTHSHYYTNTDTHCSIHYITPLHTPQTTLPLHTHFSELTLHTIIHTSGIQHFW